MLHRMRSAIVLGLALLVASGAAAVAQAKVASDQKRGELPTPAILLEPNNPIPPRIEVIAHPPKQVKIGIDMHCTRGDTDRRSSRTIRTMPPFSRRFGLPVANPDKCTIFVIATYADESELPNGYMQHGMMKLRVYH